MSNMPCDSNHLNGIHNLEETRSVMNMNESGVKNLDFQLAGTKARRVLYGTVQCE